MFAPERVAEDDPATYWSADDGLCTPELSIEFPQPGTFNTISVGEFLPLGQRITRFAVDTLEGGANGVN